MNAITGISLVALSVLVAACSGRTYTNTSGIGPATVLAHKSTECPTLSGDFTRSKAAFHKTLKMEPAENGIQLTEDDRVWIVDGKTHSPEKLVDVTYQAACENQKVEVDVSDAGVYLGRIEYSWYSPTQVLIQTNAVDSRLGKNGTEVWEILPSH